MEKPFRRWLTQYFNFSRKDRNAIITLIILIILAFTANIIIDKFPPKKSTDFSEIEKVLQKLEIANEHSNPKILFKFDPNTITKSQLDSFLIPDFVRRNIISYREAGGTFYQPSDLLKIYGMTDSVFTKIERYIIIPKDTLTEDEPQPVQVASKKISGHFDPNRADESVLYDFGFNRFQAGNLVKYRNKGGFFKKPEDLLTIYGIDSSFYVRIEKHIQIESTKKHNESPLIHQSDMMIELNSADSLELVRLKGIGPVFASRIIKYRNLLGGFYSKEQLLEVYNLPEETYFSIENKIAVDTVMIRKIRLNFTDFSELLRHPYLKKEEVNKIIKYRENNGAFKSIDQLSGTGLLDRQTFNNVRPYLSCR